MCRVYREYLKNLNSCLVRAGVYLPVSFDGDYESLFNSVLVLEQYFYFNRVLSIVDSQFKIDTYYPEGDKIYNDLVRSRILSEFGDTMQNSIALLYAEMGDLDQQTVEENSESLELRNFNTFLEYKTSSARESTNATFSALVREPEPFITQTQQEIEDLPSMRSSIMSLFNKQSKDSMSSNGDDYSDVGDGVIAEEEDEYSDEEGYSDISSTSPTEIDYEDDEYSEEDEVVEDEVVLYSDSGGGSIDDEYSEEDTEEYDEYSDEGDTEEYDEYSEEDTEEYDEYSDEGDTVEEDTEEYDEYSDEGDTGEFDEYSEEDEDTEVEEFDEYSEEDDEYSDEGDTGEFDEYSEEDEDTEVEEFDEYSEEDEDTEVEEFDEYFEEDEDTEVEEFDEYSEEDEDTEVEEFDEYSEEVEPEEEEESADFDDFEEYDEYAEEEYALVEELPLGDASAIEKTHLPIQPIGSKKEIDVAMADSLVKGVGIVAKKMAERLSKFKNGSNGS